MLVRFSRILVVDTNEANLLCKSLMKLKHLVAYRRKRIPSKRSRFMQKNLKSGEVGKWINTI